MQGEKNTKVPQGQHGSPKRKANSEDQQKGTAAKKQRHRNRKKKAKESSNLPENTTTNPCEDNSVLKEQSINLGGKSEIVINMNEVNRKNTQMNNSPRTQAKNQNKIASKITSVTELQNNSGSNVNTNTKTEKGHKEVAKKQTCQKITKQTMRSTPDADQKVHISNVKKMGKPSSETSLECTSRSESSLEEKQSAKEKSEKSNEKTYEQVLAEREAKKLAKQAAKNKAKNKISNKDQPKTEGNDLSSEKLQDLRDKIIENQGESKVGVKEIKVEESTSPAANPFSKPSADTSNEKSREQILAEREARKLAKQAAKKAKDKDGIADQSKKGIGDAPNIKLRGEQRVHQENSMVKEIVQNHEAENQQSTGIVETKKKPTTKAERRALQEAQRQAKAQLLAEKQQKQNCIQLSSNEISVKQKILSEPKKTEKSLATPLKRLRQHKIKLFNHLETTVSEQNLFINNQQIHPAMVRLGEQYAKRTVVGSNARCIAFLNALKTVIEDYETPPKKEFARSLETSIKICVDHLQNCRPLAVSVHNAYKYIKVVLTQLSADKPESYLKEELVKVIDTYIKDQIEKAAQAISSYVGEKISDGDVILTFGCSSLIYHILEEAHRKAVNFRVIVVDSRPFLEGQELLRRVVSKGIPCTCVLINAIGFIMPEVTKVLLGAHALLANGYVMSRTGTAQIALVARSYNVPVLVCCETHKFSERVQTDAIVYNELGNPYDLVLKSASKENRLADWQSYTSLHPLNLNYDVTPPELVTAVVTEVAILPCTSVPVILRIKPTEIGY